MTVATQLYKKYKWQLHQGWIEEAKEPDMIPQPILLGYKWTPKDRADFYEKVIDVGNGIRRLVEYRNLAAVAQIRRETEHAGEDRYAIQIEREPETGTRLFVPEGPDEERFNLVLSLCTDGLHRPIYDIDYGDSDVEWFAEGYRALITHRTGRSEVQFASYNSKIARFQSTSGNWHLYSQEAMSYEDYLAKLQAIPGEDAAKYRANVVRVGYGALRAPWVLKTEVEVV